MRGTGQDGGYTLLELLVSLMLLSFICIAVFGGINFGTRVWERSESTIETTDGTEQTQDILRDVFAGGRPQMKDNFSSFAGSARSVEFDGTPPRAFPSGELAHFALSLVTTAKGTRITLKVRSLADGANAREVLLGEYDGDLAISYLDASERVPAWLAVWRDRDRLPDAVRIADDRGQDGAGWPAFVARLPIAQDAGCMFDPVSIDCRKS
jgi:hypothetical protein